MNTKPLPKLVWLYYGKEPDVAANAVAEKSQQIFQRVLSDEEYIKLVDARTGDRIRIESGDFEQKRDNFIPLICIKLFRTIHITWQDGEVRVAYGLSNKGSRPELTLMNFEVPPIAQGKGLATRLFAEQVEAARIFGFDQIDAYADYKKDRNGYYTWPRLGFDKQLTPEEKKKLPDKFSYFSRLSELVDDGKLGEYSDKSERGEPVCPNFQPKNVWPKVRHHFHIPSSFHENRLFLSVKDA